MKTAEKRTRLKQFIETADDKKVKAIYTIFEENIEEENTVPDHWQDKAFVAEMEHRYNEYKSGKVKLVPLEDVEKKARQAAGKLKTKKAN